MEILETISSSNKVLDVSSQRDQSW
uniref:Uncharacterized protein n=1 Tax=Tetranychus urticae TaxID=32264 RepID=T1K3K3_TETUR